jgi:PIN domain nuclease of toxin-antitoxin system
MKALLDTHVFLWWNLNDERLSRTARDVIGDGRNEIFVSAASAWEIAIKAARGRLHLPDYPDRYVAERMLLHHFQPLPVSLNHALQVYHLPEHHPDPFDRLLIAQSQLERLPLLSGDPQISRYEVEIIW